MVEVLLPFRPKLTYKSAQMKQINGDLILMPIPEAFVSYMSSNSRLSSREEERVPDRGGRRNLLPQALTKNFSAKDHTFRCMENALNLST
jgi:hypothetical protein